MPRAIASLRRTDSSSAVRPWLRCGASACIAAGLLLGCGGGKPDNVRDPTTTPPQATTPTPPQTTEETPERPTDLSFERLEVITAVHHDRPFELRAVVRNRGPNPAEVASVDIRARYGSNYGQYTTDVHLASGTVRNLGVGETRTLNLEAQPINHSGFGRAYGNVDLLIEDDPNPSNDRSQNVQFVIQ